MKVLRVFNRQKTRAVDTTLYRRMMTHLLEELRDHHCYELAFHFVAATEMANLNETFLQHTGSTDVITFDHADVSTKNGLQGEIFICVDDALKQAKEFETTWTDEIVRYGAHGVLHLEGFDDLNPAARRKMKREENRIVKKLSEAFRLGKLARR